MCEFVSWIEVKTDGVISNLFLTAKDLKSSRGKKLAKEIGTDINGHGAIRRFYDLKVGIGTDKECTNFSSPKYFPKEIVEAIKNGEFRGFGTAGLTLTIKIWGNFTKIDQSAWKTYTKTKKQAWEDYKKIKKASLKLYRKIQEPALREYRKVEGLDIEDYKREEPQASKEYNFLVQPYYIRYKTIKESAKKDRCKSIKQAYDLYKKTSQKAFWDLFAIRANRAEAWR